MHVYDPVVDSWSALAPAPLPMGGDHCNVAAVNGRLYLVGAIRVGTSFVDGNTYMYDPSGDRWSTLQPMPTPRGASGVAVIGNVIYVAGGLAAGGRVVPSFEAFDTVSQSWVRLADMPTARDHLTAQAVNNKFYAIAGRNGGITNVQGPTEEFDPANGTWRTRVPIPVIRGGLGSGVIRNRIVVFGGEGNSGRPEQTFQENHEYDPLQNIWRGLAPMTTPRHGLYGITVDDRIFVPGGGPRIGASYSDVHEAFYLPPEQPPVITSAGNAASYAATLNPGGLVALFGERLSYGRQIASRLPAPTQMNAVRVTVNGAAVPLLFVSPGQVNFHLPHTLAPGPARITITNATSESQALAATIDPAAAPGLFSLDGSGQGQGAILIAGTGLIARATRDAFSRAAVRGIDVVEIYSASLGAVDNPPAAGQPAPGNPPTRTVAPAIVEIGGFVAEVIFSGLAPGTVGLYQINARVPQASAIGIAVPVSVRMTNLGRASNEVTMAVIDPP